MEQLPPIIMSPDEIEAAEEKCTDRLTDHLAELERKPERKPKPRDVDSSVKDYSVKEVAALTGLSERTIIRLFEHEPGVIILERPGQLHKRRYRTIRIPRAVYLRVLSKVSV